MSIRLLYNLFASAQSCLSQSRWFWSLLCLQLDLIGIYLMADDSLTDYMYTSPICKNVVITERCLYMYILQNVKTLRKLCLGKGKHQKKLGLVRAQLWNLSSKSSFSSYKSKCLVFMRYAE